MSCRCQLLVSSLSFFVVAARPVSLSCVFALAVCCQMCAFMYWCVLVCVGVCWCVLVCAGGCVLVWVGECWCVLLCVGVCGVVCW